MSQHSASDISMPTTQPPALAGSPYQHPAAPPTNAALSESYPMPSVPETSASRSHPAPNTPPEEPFPPVPLATDTIHSTTASWPDETPTALRQSAPVNVPEAAMTMPRHEIPAAPSAAANIPVTYSVPEWDTTYPDPLPPPPPVSSYVIPDYPPIAEESDIPTTFTPPAGTYALPENTVAAPLPGSPVSLPASEALDAPKR
ncbi:MAG: hypothetical protein ACK4RK_05125 [Gemmataceae bacterium]